MVAYNHTTDEKHNSLHCSTREQQKIMPKSNMNESTSTYPPGTVTSYFTDRKPIKNTVKITSHDDTEQYDFILHEGHSLQQ